AAELDRLNRERQAIEAATVAQAEAEALAALGLEEKGAVVVTAAEGWHPGVVGLVAARLKERFGRPAFAIALEPGGMGTGSGRSIAGIDLGRAVREAVSAGLLLKGGGHAMAAGVTLRKDALGGFRAYLEDTPAPAAGEGRREEALLTAGAATAAAANGDLMATIARAGPFGAHNPEPVLAFPAHTVAYAEEVGQAHMRARLRAGDGSLIDAIAFRAVGQKLGSALAESRGRPVHAAGTLCLDRWNGVERVQLRLRRPGPADPGFGAPEPCKAAQLLRRCGQGYLARAVLQRESITMSKLQLSVAVGNYDRVRPLIDGAVQIDGVNPVFMNLPPEEIFFRAFRSQDFDICELSLSSFTVKTADRSCPYVGIPAFVSRAFR